MGVGVNTNLKSTYEELLDRAREVSDLNSAAAILSWDQSTYMPPGGAPARARQIALLQQLAHQRATDPALGHLLDRLEQEAADWDPDSDQAAMIRVARHDYERAVRIPSDFVAEFAAHTSHAYQVWTQARPANDFTAVRPLLERTLELSRRYADFFPGYDHPADPLIAETDLGMTVATIRPLFAELRAFLTPLVQAIVARPAADDSCLHQHYPEADQWAFGEKIIRDYGYDFNRGRQDKTHHPFMTRFSAGDCRITTRVYEDYVASALFSTLHEAGHALYELGIAPEYDATPLGHGTSAGVHESQSRLWENVVGRSRGFWEHYYPQLQAVFPTQLGNVTLDTFVRAINKVKSSLIRVEADEVTYNLHVIIRFELECALLEGSATIEQLPQLWRRMYADFLGVEPPDDRDGVLQDVHWFAGPIGGSFQGYTLGNILAGQFYAAALTAHPTIPAEISRGRFDTLHTWLREHIYRHGRKYTTAQLVERVTGGPIRLAPYQEYLTRKYSALYDL